MLSREQSFGHYVCNIVPRRNMNELDTIVGDLVSNNMTVYVDVFGALMEDNVLGYVECSLVVTVYCCRSGM